MVFADLLSRPPGFHPSIQDLVADVTQSGCPICATEAGRDICAHHWPAKLNVLVHQIDQSAVRPVGLEVYSPEFPREFQLDVSVIKDAYETADEKHCRRILKGLRSGQANYFTRRYRLVDGLIYTRPEVGAGPRRCRPRLVLPASNRELIATALDSVHATTTSGHLGVEATYQRLLQRYDFPRMLQTVEKYVRGYYVCQENRHSTQKRYGQYHGLEVPAPFPGSALSTDFTFGLPPCEHPLNGQQYDGIQVYVCRLTRRVRFLPVAETISAPEAAALYRMEVLPHWGMMRSLVSDRDPRFTSAFWTELAQALGISLKMSTADHPQTDGQSESAFGYLGVILRTFCQSNPNWVEMLSDLEFAVNSHTSGSRDGRTPFEMWGGFQPLEPADFVLPQRALQSQQTVQDFISNGRLAAQAAVDAIRTAQDKIAERTDMHRRTVSYNAGDKVWVHRSALLPPSAEPQHRDAKSKLLPLWNGPLKVVAMRGPNAVKVDLTGTQWRAHPVFNVEKVKPFVPNFREWTDPDLQAQQPQPDGEMVVGAIVGTRIRRGRRQWLIRWQGMGRAYDSWHPLENFVSAAGFTSPLVKFEIDRTGSTDEIVALHHSKPSHSNYPDGTPGTVAQASDGFLLRYATGHETMNQIAHSCGESVRPLVKMNRPNIKGLSKTTIPPAGWAIRIRAVALYARARAVMYLVRAPKALVAGANFSSDGRTIVWPPHPSLSVLTSSQ